MPYKKVLPENVPEEVKEHLEILDVTKEIEQTLANGFLPDYACDSDSDDLSEEECIEEVEEHLEILNVTKEIEQTLANGFLPDYACDSDSDDLSEEECIEEIIDELRAMEGIAEKPILDNSTYRHAKRLISLNILRNLTPENSDNTVWLFNGRIYMPLEQKDLEQLVYDSLTEQEKQSINNVQPYLKRIATYIQMELFSDANKEQYCFNETDFAKIQNHIVFQNGVYDVATGELLPFSDQCPYYLEVNAVFKTEGDIQPVYYEKIKVYATGADEESMRMFDIITAALFLNRQIKHIFVAGNASNSGKSKYMELLERMMPLRRVCRLSPSELNERFALGEADGATLFSCADIEMEMISPKVASTLKRLTGDTFVRVEKKGKTGKSIRVLTKVILATNGCFGTKVPDKGLINRLIVLPFVNEVKEEDRDENLLEKMWEERNDIMTMCAEKLHQLMDKEGKFEIPVSRQSKELKASWTSYKTFAEEFLAEELEVTGENDDNFDRRELHKLYMVFCNKCALEYGKERYQPLTEKELLDKLDDLTNGRIKYKRVSKINGERLTNAKWRVCGLKKR